MGEKKIKKITYKTSDLVPALPEPVEIDIKGKTYVARCPNDYEFFSIYSEFNKYSGDIFGQEGNALPIVEILTSMFPVDSARDIHRRLKGEKAEIDLIGDLGPALKAVFEHFEPLVKARQVLIQKQLNTPKE